MKEQIVGLQSQLVNILLDRGVFISDDIQERIVDFIRVIEEQPADAGCGEDAGIGPSVKAEAHSDDHVFEVTFDAKQWFAKSVDSTIVGLANEGWADGYAADEVAQYMAEFNDELAAMFHYLELIANKPSKKDECGFSCTVDRKQAMDWLEAMRPEVAKAIRDRENGETNE